MTKIDPYRVLGLAPGASGDDVRQAYLARIKEAPPDRHPERFEAIRDAYEKLSDPRRRAALVLEADPEPRLMSLLETPGAGRPAAGLEAWLDAIAEASRGR